MKIFRTFAFLLLIAGMLGSCQNTPVQLLGRFEVPGDSSDASKPETLYLSAPTIAIGTETGLLMGVSPLQVPVPPVQLVTAKRPSLVLATTFPAKFGQLDLNHAGLLLAGVLYLLAVRSIARQLEWRRRELAARSDVRYGRRGLPLPQALQTIENFDLTLPWVIDDLKKESDSSEANSRMYQPWK